MVLFIQYTLGFLLLIYAFYQSTLAFLRGNLGDFYHLFIAMVASLASFIFLKDFWFAPIVNRIEKLFMPDGFDTGSDFSEVDSFIYKKEFAAAIEWLDEHIKENPDCAKAYLKKCQIQYDHLKDPNSTVATGYERLNSKELSEDDERLIFLILDILQDNQKFEYAKILIKTVIEKLKHKALIERLEQRLESLG